MDRTSLFVCALLFVGCGGDTATTPPDAGRLPDAGAEASAIPEAGPDAAKAAPVTLSSAALWLEADYGITGTSVAQWKDRGAGAHHATQASATAQPKLIASAQNGLPVVRFDGAQSFMNLPAGFSDFTKGMTAFVVVNPSNNKQADRAARFFEFAPTYGTLTDSILFVRYWPGGNDELFYQTYPGGAPGPGVAAANAVHDGQWQMLGVSVPGGGAGMPMNASLYYNGGLAAASPVDVPPVLVRASNFLGKSNLTGDPLLQADVAAIIVFDQELVPADRQSIESYLKSKWGL